MKKFTVNANVQGFGFRPAFFSSRNAALRFIAQQSAWHGGEFYLNGRLKATVAIGSFHAG